MLWTPCAQPPQPLALGPFQLLATKDCPVVAPHTLPLVVVSHGYGGTNLSHHDVAQTLADSGFAVLAISHPLDAAPHLARGGSFAALEWRPADITRAINGLLRHPTFGPQIDAERIGFFGFSRGGYTGLVLAGAKPDFVHPQFACVDLRIPLCQDLHERRIPPMAYPPDARIKAYVLADPLSAFPSRTSVYSVRAPVQLWASAWGGDGIVPGSVQALGQLLPATTEVHVVAGAGHFAFLPPCTPQLAVVAPAVCADPVGFDRPAFQQRFNAEVLRFFVQKL